MPKVVEQPGMGTSLLDMLDARFEENMSRRRRHLPKWKEAVRFVDPSRARWTGADTDDPTKSRSAIIDETATWCHGVAVAGNVSGMASPGRPWFQLRLGDYSLNQKGSVKAWLRTMRTAVLTIFERSNFYQQLGEMFGDELIVANAPLGIFEDPDPSKYMRFEVPPIGSWAIAQDGAGRPIVFQRELTKTIRQLLNEFGEANVSSRVKMRAQEQGGLSDTVEVRHMILPNPDYIPESMVVTRLPYQEVYWEHLVGSGLAGRDPGIPSAGTGTGGRHHEKPLKRSGYHEFPYALARGRRNIEDTYGVNCETYNALASIKQLQVQEDKVLLGLELEVEPPMLAGSGVDRRHLSIVPGTQTKDAGVDGSGGSRPLYQVKLDYEALEAKSEQVRMRIKRAYKVDVFQTVLSDDRSQRATATEIDETRREALQALGPSLQRHSDDVFDVVVDRAMAIILRRSELAWQTGEPSLVPPPPEELRGQEIRIQYISEIAQAQQAQGLMSIERVVDFGTRYSQFQPEALDRLDVDEIMERYADSAGVDPSVIRDLDEAIDIRNRRAQAQQEAAMREQAAGMAGAVRNLSETRMGGDSALDRMVQAAAI